MPSFAAIIAFLNPFVPLLKPELLQVEDGLQSQIKAAIPTLVGSPDLQAFLVAVDSGIDAFVKVEINKLG